MTEKLPCAVVRDLLPGELEGMNSPETSALLTSHLESCPDCRAIRDAMAAPTPAMPEPREVQGLKKVRKAVHRRVRTVILAAVLALVLLVSIPFCAFFVVGFKEPGWYSTVDVSGELLTVSGMTSSSALAVRKIEFAELPGGVAQVNLRTVLPLFWREGRRGDSHWFSRTITQVQSSDGTILWYEGTKISVLASNLYRHSIPYVGDASGVSRLVRNLGLQGVSLELKTESEPYGLVLCGAQDLDEKQLQKAAFALLACVDNLSFVQIEDTGLEFTAQEATEFLGRDVKSFASSPSDMQRLVEALSLAAGPAGSLVP